MFSEIVAVTTYVPGVDDAPGVSVMVTDPLLLVVWDAVTPDGKFCREL